MHRPLIIFVILTTLASISHGQYTLNYRSFEDFRGQSFCATRFRENGGKCCTDRMDECSVPIAGTLCYCDEFCENHINPDCCPDYEPVCKGIVGPDPTIPKCEIQTPSGPIYMDGGTEAKINCNLCKCGIYGKADCEQDVCMSDMEMISEIERKGRSLGWKPSNYSEFYGQKLSRGLTYRLGTFVPRVKVKSMSRLGHSIEKLPQSFNSMTKVPGSVSEIPDQGWCASSWAVSTASVASDRIGITQNFVRLSSQNLLSCVRHQQGCEGGHLDNAWRYLIKNGIADEDCYPYEAVKGRCRAKKGDTLRTMQCDLPFNGRETLYKMGPAYSLNNETDIMWEIYHYGPVQATMWVYPDFFTYQSGIYRRSKINEGNGRGFHSVRLIGWGEESFGGQRTKYWIAANSWGRWWGESGFFRILRGENECDIEDYVLAALADDQKKLNGRQIRSHYRRKHRNAV